MLDVLMTHGWRVDISLFAALAGLTAVFLAMGAGFVAYRRWQPNPAKDAAAQNPEVLALKEKLRAATGEVAAVREELSQEREQSRLLGALLIEARALQQELAHEFLQGPLDLIRRSAQDTLDGLRAQEALRGPEGVSSDMMVLQDRQRNVISVVSELIEHATNMVGVSNLGTADDRRQALSIKKLVQEELINLTPYAEAKGVQLNFKSPAVEVEPIVANRGSVEGILRNVTQNAIKYSRAGGVVDIAVLQQHDAGRKVVWIEVRDDGKGIPEAGRERIFELKQRGEGQFEPGSGLGLHYARELARRQGGDVLLVESTLNQGSTFRIVLPCP